MLVGDDAPLDEHVCDHVHGYVSDKLIMNVRIEFRSELPPPCSDNLALLIDGWSSVSFDLPEVLVYSLAHGPQDHLVLSLVLKFQVLFEEILFVLSLLFPLKSFFLVCLALQSDLAP